MHCPGRVTEIAAGGAIPSSLGTSSRSKHLDKFTGTLTVELSSVQFETARLASGFLNWLACRAIPSSRTRDSYAGPMTRKFGEVRIDPKERDNSMTPAKSAEELKQAATTLARGASELTQFAAALAKRAEELQRRSEIFLKRAEQIKARESQRSDYLFSRR
jgi:hypothetical protein